MRYLSRSLIRLCIVPTLALMLLWPVRVQADSVLTSNHWTKCVLTYGPHGGFQQKACYRILMPNEHRQRIGHIWRELPRKLLANGGYLSVRITYPVFQQPVDMGSRAVSCAWQWRGLIASASSLYSVPTRAIAATLCTESTSSNIGCNVSTDGFGSEGLMQLLPSTAASVMGVSVAYAQTELCNPGWNILAGAHYLLIQYRAFGSNWRSAAGAYNAGSWINYSYLTKWPYGWDYYYG